MAEITKFKASVKASGMTLQEASELAGISKPTMCSRLEEPSQFRLYELKSLYNGMGQVGMSLLLEAVNDFFCHEDCV